MGRSGAGYPTYAVRGGEEKLEMPFTARNVLGLCWVFYSLSCLQATVFI